MKSLVVLAGGFGTRLRSVVSDVPKPMAPVNGTPFIYLLLKRWLDQGLGFDQLVFSIGYKGDVIQRFFGDRLGDIKIRYIEEMVPLGTGGALIKVCSELEGHEICVINADTWFLPNINFEWPTNSDWPTIWILLNRTGNASRYGAIQQSLTGKITAIKQGFSGTAWINGGVYFINALGVKAVASVRSSIQPVSLEQELFKLWINNREIDLVGIQNRMPFLDIGVPDDYFRVEHFLRAL